MIRNRKTFRCGIKQYIWIAGLSLNSCCLLLLFLAACHKADKSMGGSNIGNNYIIIDSAWSHSEIIKQAANMAPSERQLQWQQRELVAFIHFGMNTFTNREWGTGDEDPKLFNPSRLDPDQWVKVCKDAGFREVILTAKHHDGFCLWPSKYTEHSVKNSPWKNGKGDVVREVANACRKYDIGFGIYLSPWDRNCPFYGDTKKYNAYFEHQLTELLTNYGKIDEVWFDGANGVGPNGKIPVYDYNTWYELIRKLQPEAVISVMGPDVRWVGTETGYGRKTEWSVVPVDQRSQSRIALNSQHVPLPKDSTFTPSRHMLRGEDLGSRKKLFRAKALVWYPVETNVSIRPGWFYHADENNKVKTPQKLLDIYYSSVGRNGVLLLNIPPGKDGLINENDIESLREWRSILDATFRINLAENAEISSPDGLHPQAMLDGNDSTDWTTKGMDTSGVIEFSLKGTKTFDVLALQENIRVGQRVEKFRLDYWDGRAWKEAVSGTTIGYKRLLRFDPITANKVRLSILSSRLNPTIAEFGLYKRPAVAE